MIVDLKQGIELTDRQRLNWLQLLRSENIGTVTFWTLIQAYGTAENAILALPDLAQKGGKRSIRIAKKDDVLRELERATRSGVRYVCAGESDYPRLLREVPEVPPILSVKGSAGVLNTPSVGIVGSRTASAVGIKLARQFAAKLGHAGFSIVSGLARGIDAAAHKAALATGTIAAMAGGIDHVYPPENAHLYEEVISNGGAIVSEMPFGWVPRAIDFPRRNRLIAGMSLGLLVVEAAQRSGSLITARLANEMGRIVFAIPGSPLDPRAVGTNGLIKNGANLVTEPNDIIETLIPLTHDTQFELLESAQSPSPRFDDNGNTPYDTIDDEIRTRVQSALSTVPIDLDSLALYTDVSVPQLYLVLLELDIAGRIIRHSGGLVSLRPQ